MLIATLEQGMLIKRSLHLIDRIYAQDTPIIQKKFADREASRVMVIRRTHSDVHHYNV